MSTTRPATSWAAGVRRSEVRTVGAIVESTAVTTVARVVSGGRLRVVAYHDVTDPEAFARQVAALTRVHRLVTGDDVERAVRGGRPLPRGALWLTFDDGHPGAFAVAGHLAEAGVQACMFVCPSTLGTCTPFWWQVVDQAVGAGLVRPADGDRFSRPRLKAIADHERRAEVDVLAQRLRDHLGRPPVVAQATPEDLRRWVGAGHEVGNHTWDHPCLVRCSPAEQRQQVVRAHEALVALGVSPRFLAYPNGDLGHDAERAARELGYVASFLFDHRLTKVQGDPGRLSRLRLDASAPIPRARSITSGAHSAAFGLRR